MEQEMETEHDKRVNSALIQGDIEKAAKNARSIIADAAAEAVKVLSVATSEAIKVTQVKGMVDHDLLIELRTTQQMMLIEIREIKDGTSKRISDLEVNKLNIKDSFHEQYKDEIDKSISDLQLKVSELEKSKIRQNVLVGIGTGILTVLVGILLYHLFGIR